MAEHFFYRRNYFLGKLCESLNTNTDFVFLNFQNDLSKRIQFFFLKVVFVLKNILFKSFWRRQSINLKSDMEYL